MGSDGRGGKGGEERGKKERSWGERVRLNGFEG